MRPQHLTALLPVALAVPFVSVAGGAKASAAVCLACAALPPGHRECTVHGRDAIMWKCLWCCAPATHECRGRLTYYCDRCHDMAIENAAATGTRLDWRRIVA